MQGNLSVCVFNTLLWSRSYLLAGQHLSCLTTDTAARRLSSRNMRNVGDLQVRDEFCTSYNVG